MLTCYLVRRRLDALVDGALGERGARTAGDHVERCRRCRREADRIRRLQGLLRESLSAATPADWTGFWPGIARALEERRHAEVAAPARRTRVARALRLHPRLAFGGALAAALVVSVTAWQLTVGSAPDPGFAVVRSANTDVPGVSVMVYSPPEKDLAVVWVFGLED